MYLGNLVAVMKQALLRRDKEMVMYGIPRFNHKSSRKPTVNNILLQPNILKIPRYYNTIGNCVI